MECKGKGSIAIQCNRRWTLLNDARLDTKSGLSTASAAEGDVMDLFSFDVVPKILAAVLTLALVFLTSLLSFDKSKTTKVLAFIVAIAAATTAAQVLDVVMERSNDAKQEELARHQRESLDSMEASAQQLKQNLSDLSRTITSMDERVLELDAALTSASDNLQRLEKSSANVESSLKEAHVAIAEIPKLLGNQISTISSEVQKVQAANDAASARANSNLRDVKKKLANQEALEKCREERSRWSSFGGTVIFTPCLGENR